MTIKIRGLTSIVTTDSFSKVVDLLFDEIVSKAVEGEGNFLDGDIIWIDQNGTTPFELLHSKLLSRLGELHESPDLLVNSSLKRVRYSQCFDLSGILQTLNIEPFELSNTKFIVLLNVYDLFKDMKLTDRDGAHSILNQIMMRCRQMLSLEHNLDICLFDVESRGSPNETFMLDYYVTRKYSIGSEGITQLI